VSTDRLHLRGLSILCGLLVLVFLYFTIRQKEAMKIDSHSFSKNVSITLVDEKRSLPAGSWQAIPVDIPYKCLLNIDLGVASGNPIDVALINGNQLDLLANKGWTNATRQPGFTANRTETYHVTAEIAEGSYDLVFRHTLLSALSTAETNVIVKISLDPL
jgi:hypothetical protein